MRILRWFWGILVILSVLWIGYGFLATGDAYGNTIENNVTDSEAYEAGAVIGAGIGLTFFLCTGIPFLLLSSILYWRNGVGIERKKEKLETERRHQEQLAALQGQVNALKPKQP
jgi:hypothetical protein